MSETSTARELLAPFCEGSGIDCGAGGDGIKASTICIDRAEDDGRRAHVGQSPTHLVGDVADLKWFRDGVLDYVYSSHTAEDFDDTPAILREWLRVLRPGGNLVLFLPDQQTYVADCERNGTLPNQAHKHADFSLAYVRSALVDTGVATRELTAIWPFPGNPYSFALVVQKV